MRDRLTYLAYATGWAVVRRLPERAADGLFRLAADVVWRRRGPAVRRLEANLARVVPDADEAAIRQLSRDGMRSYLRYWSETFRLPDWSHQRIVARMRTHEEQRLREPLAAGRGVVVALPHTANWDHAGAWACLTGARVTTVAERLRPERLYERFLAYRESLGMEILPLTGGGDVLRVLATRLRAGGFVPLLGDRDLRATGVPVELFGEPATFPPGPAILAIQTGAALVPATLWYDGPELHVLFHPEVPVPATGTTRDKVSAMAQQVAGAFETGIAAHPQDWHMLQPLWRADLDPDRVRTPETAPTGP